MFAKAHALAWLKSISSASLLRGRDSCIPFVKSVTYLEVLKCQQSVFFFFFNFTNFRMHKRKEIEQL